MGSKALHSTKSAHSRVSVPSTTAWNSATLPSPGTSLIPILRPVMAQLFLPLSRSSHSMVAPSNSTASPVINLDSSGACKCNSNFLVSVSQSHLTNSTNLTSAPGTCTIEGRKRVPGNMSMSCLPSSISSVTKLWSKASDGKNLATRRSPSPQAETSWSATRTSVPRTKSTPGQPMGRPMRSASCLAVVPGATRRGPHTTEPLMRPTVSSGPSPRRGTFASGPASIGDRRACKQRRRGRAKPADSQRQEA
mmetsp:Transcript_125418/g.360356  ORF Transcript_125418/g.360356 Transcript_125418/m.360356 type:complete len:250 (+) Transcript_125418:1158-1907(+)